MAKLEFDDFARFERMFEEYTKADVQSEAKIAVYKGAGTAVKAIADAISSHTTHDNPVDGMTKAEQKALESGLGITPMKVENGVTNVKIGFDGYDTSRKTKRWPKGVPISVTARSLRKGTSWRVKDDFISPAIRKAEKNVISVMEQALEEELKKKFKE